MKIEKITKWFKCNKNDISRVCIATLCSIAGYIMIRKVANEQLVTDFGDENQDNENE